MSLRPVLLSLVVSLYFLTEQALPGESPAPSGANAPKANPPVRTDHYGDPLPKGVRFRLGSIRLRHDGPVTALAWSADGRTLMSAGWDDMVRLWQIPGGKQLAKWKKMGSVAFSLDGRTLACGGEGWIRFCDVATGKELRRFRVPKKNDLFLDIFSPDGKLLAAVDWEKSVHLYAVDSGKELRFLEGKVLPSGYALAFSPDGRTLIGATDKGVVRWTIGTGAKDKILENTETFPVVFSLAFSPDGKTLAAVIGDGIRNVVTLRSWPADKELRRFDAKDYELETLAFSANGKLLAAVGMGSIHLWDPANGKELHRFEENEGEVMGLAFSPDNSLLASASRDGVVTVRYVDSRKTPRPLIGVGHRLDALAMTADGRTLLTHAYDGALTLWDGRDGRRLRTLAHWHGSGMTLLVSPNGGRALLSPWFEDAPLWWDLATGRRLPAFSGIPKRIACAAFAPDSTLLALGSVEGIVYLRETAKGGAVRRLKEENDAAGICELAFCPDGRTLAVSHTDGNLILWELNTGRPHHRISGPHGKSTRKLAFSFDGRLLAVAWNDGHIIHLFETISGQEVRQLRSDPAEIGSLAFAADNRILAIGDVDSSDRAGVSESTIRLWDWPTDKQILVLRGHQRDIYTLVFSPDGTSLVSHSDDNTVLSWDVAALTRRRSPSKELAAAKVAELWSDLASKDAARAQRAVAELIQAPDATLPFLAQSLPPVPPARMARIAMLIADLDSEEYARREKAMRELRKLGEPAAPALRRVLKEKPTLEVRKRITALLEGIDERPLSPQWLRTLRALQVLESLGTPEAKQVLEGLTRGASAARLTEEAKASLQRLNRR